MTTELAIRPEQSSFSPAQTEALKRQIGVENVPDDELAVFFHQCVRTGLDPFARQVYLIPRWNNKKRRHDYTIQTSIDGARLIAERTGRYAGSDAPTFSHDEKGRPFVVVRVWKLVDGQRYPFEGVAFWDEYVQLNKEGQPQGLWERMPRTMLAKCAEMQALRKAFPADLSGIYSDDEMSQADSHRPSRAPEELGAEAADNNPPPASTTLERVDMATGEVVGQPNIDEPPYAPGPDDAGPNAAQLAERVKAIGVDWLQLLQDVKRNADDEGIDVPPRTGDIDKKPYHPFRSLLQRHVEELEKAKGGQQQALA